MTLLGDDVVIWSFRGIPASDIYGPATLQALLITCALINLSAVFCCHYLMTMALAHIQATQRHQAIVWLNVRWVTVEDSRVKYGSRRWSTKGRQDVQRSNCIQTTKGGRRQTQAFASRPTPCKAQHAKLARKWRDKKNKAAMENKTIFKAVI